MPGAAAPGSSARAGNPAAAEETSSPRKRSAPSPPSRGGAPLPRAFGNKDDRSRVGAGSHSGCHGLSGSPVGIDVDPFVEFRHRNLQADRGNSQDRVPPANQLAIPRAALAPENLGVNALRVDQQDFLDARDVAVGRNL